MSHTMSAQTEGPLALAGARDVDTPIAGSPGAVSSARLRRIGLLGLDPVARRDLAAALARSGRSLEVFDDAESLSGLLPRLVVVGGTRSISALRETLRRLHRASPESSVVVVLPSDSRAAVRAIVEAGAAGVVFESDVERALEPTISAAESGQIAVPADRRRDVDRPTLSRREKQTLGLVVMGLSNREIASRLYLAESTVKCHLSSAFVKLGVRSRHEAVQVILDPERGMGLGILGISGAERRALEPVS
jgi:DNA-binding NarL/FixJ family response regulator